VLGLIAGIIVLGGCASRGISPIFQPMRDVPEPGSIRSATDEAARSTGARTDWAARELIDAVAEAEQFQRDY
jgi:hypothetical protein